ADYRVSDPHTIGTLVLPFHISYCQAIRVVPHSYGRAIGQSHGRQDRSLAGHFGADGAQDARYDGAAAWIWHRPADRTDERPRARVELRHAVPRPAETRARGIHRVGMGHLREQSESQVLPAHTRGTS